MSTSTHLSSGVRSDGSINRMQMRSALYLPALLKQREAVDLDAEQCGGSAEHERHRGSALHQRVPLVMITSQYNRLGVSVTASNSEVIRASQRMLSAKGKGRALRAERHRWYRALLATHARAFAMYCYVQGGR